MELTGEILQKAKELISNWNTDNDKGIFIDQDQNYCLERVPEWAPSWEWIESNDDDTLINNYMSYYGMSKIVEVPTTYEVLYPYGYDYIISTSDGDIYNINN